MSLRLVNVVVVVVRSAAALSFGAEVSTQHLFLTAWTATALFGRCLDLREADGDGREELPGSAAERDLILERCRQATERLALTDSQQVAIDQTVGQIQPLIVELLAALKEKLQALAALQPDNDGFLIKTGRLSNDIGTLATQLALSSNKMKTDIHGILSAGQQAVLNDLQTAFDRVG